jgi:adenine-specific DNA-methyltransferase
MATSKVKKNGVVYTPTYIVEMILEQSNYNSGNIIKKHVIDNSCGDGKFLVEIVKRYINEFIKNKGLDIITKSELKSDLEQYIHGIELDEEEVIKCINNLNEVVSLYGLENIKWDVNQGDTLQVSKYNGMMDYVLGNPPYVRVHNLSDNFNYIKSQKFTSSGMTDLFIIFYEIGIEMLNETGVLGYITPSSIFNSVAGSEFRKYVTVNKCIF